MRQGAGASVVLAAAVAEQPASRWRAPRNPFTAEFDAALDEHARAGQELEIAKELWRNAARRDTGAPSYQRYLRARQASQKSDLVWREVGRKWYRAAQP